MINRSNNAISNLNYCHSMKDSHVTARWVINGGKSFSSLCNIATLIPPEHLKNLKLVVPIDAEMLPLNKYFDSAS